MLSSGLSSGVLIIGHGTRDERGVADFLETVRQVRAGMSTMPVQLGFLELASPTIHEGFKKLIDQGVRTVLAVPLLLFAAGHIRQDIPRVLAQLQDEHPDREIHQLPHLGCRRQIVQLSAWRHREAMASVAPVSEKDTVLVLVGRGSGDREATREMDRFSELRQRETPIGSMKVCFLAVERPSLRDIVPEIGNNCPKRAIVQPHLLFPGYLTRQIQAEIEAARESWPETDWIVTDPLGPHPLLAEAVRETVSAALERLNRPASAVVSERTASGNDRIAGQRADLVPGGLSE